MRNWIPIKSDYLIDNFDSLLESLSDADFENASDGLLDESVGMLEEVARGLLDDWFPHKMGMTVEVDDIFIRNVRIVLASIYSSLKVGGHVHVLVASLLDTLVVNGGYADEDSLDKIKDILVNLALGRNIDSIPYNLKDLEQDAFDFPLFKQKLLTFKFNGEGMAKSGYESTGSCLVGPEGITINTVRLQDIDRQKLRTVVEMGFGIKLMGEEKKKITDQDFKEQVGLLNRISQALPKTGEIASRTLKRYGEDETFFVKAIDVNPSSQWVKCKTIDPDYEPMELYLDLMTYYTINTWASISIYREDFIKNLKTGQPLKVRLTEKDGKRYFSLYEELRNFINNPSNFYEDYAAIYLSDYRGGTRWLTEMGHTVNIMHIDWDEDIREASVPDCNKFIIVNDIRAAIDRNGNMVMNAKRAYEIYEIEEDQHFIEEIPDNLLDWIFSCWENDCPTFQAPSESIGRLEPGYVRAFGHLLSVTSQSTAVSFHERYYNAFGARLLSSMIDDSHDEIFNEFTMTFLKALWAFSQDPGHKWMTVPMVDEDLKDIESVCNCCDIIRILSTYKHERHVSVAYQDTGVDLSRLKKLVEASNALSGNMADTELNRIKHTISQCLGIESIYKEEASDKYWFGEESEMLEFKTSVVYPPVRNGEIIANPDIQIWQIIKTVNGFLNSLHGGTLLIGVNDFGNAIGIGSDINWLAENYRIRAHNIDQYLLFIKLRLDNAFHAYRRNDEDSEITSMRLRYSMLQVEGNDIVRIDIDPYEYGCVRIKQVLKIPGQKDLEKPGYIKESYLRTANSTEELTDRMREKIEVDKRNVIKDSERQKYIAVQEAIESSRYIKLKKHQSSRRESDKTIEPIELLPMRGLVVGIPKGENELRVFKLSRCEEVEVLADTFSASRHSYSVDPFNMLATERNVARVCIRLDRLGSLLAKEMYPYSSNFIERDDRDPDFPYVLDCNISDMYGIGSFCLSVLGHFKIIDGPELQNHIRMRIEEAESTF